MLHCAAAASIISQSLTPPRIRTMPRVGVNASSRTVGVPKGSACRRGLFCVMFCDLEMAYFGEF